MKVKITGVVKYKGEWRTQGDEIDVTDEIGQQMIDQAVAEEIEGASDELQELRDRAKELGVTGWAQAGEEKLRARITEKEAELAKAEEERLAAEKVAEALTALRAKATELGIEGAAEKDADTLTAEIAAKENA